MKQNLLLAMAVVMVGCEGGEPRSSGLPDLQSEGGEPRSSDLQMRADIWVSSVVLDPDSKVRYVGKTKDLGFTSISKNEDMDTLPRISVGDTIKGIRIGAIKCSFHEKDASYGGEQFMWRGRWVCYAGRNKHEIENAVATDGGKRFDYIYIAPVTLKDHVSINELSSSKLSQEPAEGKSITKKDVVGVYEKNNGRVSAKYIFHENGKVDYKDVHVSNVDVLGWKIVGNEVHIINLIYTKGTVTVCRIYPNGVLKTVGLVSRGRRIEIAQEEQGTFKKLKGKLAELARLPVQEKECLKCKNIIKFPDGDPCPPCPKCGFDYEAAVHAQRMFSLRNLMAEQGDAEAQLELGQMYFEATNLVTSYTWLSIATLNGSVEAEKTKRAVAKKMTTEQISKAEAQAKKMIEEDMRLLKKKE